MSRLVPLSEGWTAAQEMVAALLPRGPIWALRNADIAGMTAALGDESIRFHNRMVALMAEAYPGTADETIDEWESVFGLPICGDAPTDLASRRAALAGAYAAQGIGTPDEFIQMIRIVLGDPAAAVTITERPWGGTFCAWVSHAWDTLGSAALVHHWRVSLPSGVSDDLVHIIGCLLEAFKPAHTVVTLRSTTCSGGSSSSLSISNGPSYDFGVHAIGTQTAHTFTITNVGAGTAKDISCIALSTSFRFVGGSFPGTGGTLGRELASGNAGTVVVEFVPVVAGPAGGFINFEYCDGSSRAYVGRQLVGTGT